MDLGSFYIAFANTNIDYSLELWSFYEENLGIYGVENKILGKKLRFLFKQFEQAPMYFEEGIKQISSGRTVEELDDCIKHLSALPIGSVQSYLPNLIHMTSKLCERDFGCDFDNLVQRGMVITDALNTLYSELSGIPTIIPPFPVIQFTFTDNILSLFYETDMMWLIDSLRMLPDIKMQCMVELGESRGTTREDIQKLILYIAELSPQLLIEYGNVSNFIANRPHYPIHHDWGVVSLSILQADLEIHESDEFFWNEVGVANPFTKCMRGQVKIGWELIKKLKKVLG